VKRVLKFFKHGRGLWMKDDKIIERGGTEFRVGKSKPGEERFRSQIPPSGNLFSPGQKVPSDQFKRNYDEIEWEDYEAEVEVIIP